MDEEEGCGDEKITIKNQARIYVKVKGVYNRPVTHLISKFRQILPLNK